MKKLIREWLRRYLPAEIVSLAVTIVVVLIFYDHGRIAIALGGSWAGGIAYFGCIIATDIYMMRRALHRRGEQYSYQSFLKNLRALFAEFGVAELLDGFLIRPVAMYYIPIVTGNLLLGSVTAKFLADITFYIPTIISYEWTKSKLRKF